MIDRLSGSARLFRAARNDGGMSTPEQLVPTVRRADPTGSDAAQVGKLVADYLIQTEREKAEHLDGAHGPTPLPEKYRHEVDEPCSAYASADVYVAELQGHLVGVAVVLGDQDADEPKRVWVDPAARGTGAGSALLNAALTRDKQRPLRLTVWRWRDDAIRLYSRRGFQAVASWDPRPDLICMERRT